MPNAIKYSTSAQTLALKKGNFYIGTGDVGKGPTSTTDYYNGITPPSGGYTIYLNKASGGPSIYTASNDTQLVSLTNTISYITTNYISNGGNFANGTISPFIYDYTGAGGVGQVVSIANDRPYVGSTSTNALELNYNGGRALDATGLLTVGQTYTFSFWAKITSGSSFIIGWNNQNGSGDTNSWSSGGFNLTTSWQRYSQVFTYNAARTTFYFYTRNQTVGTLAVFTEFQLSLGSAPCGPGLTTATESINWFLTQTDKMVFNADYPAIVTDGLVLNLDAGFAPSITSLPTNIVGGGYNSYTPTWYDLGSGGSNGTLTNSPTFSSANGGSIVFDGVDDYVSLGNNLDQNGPLTIMSWIYTTTVSSGPRAIISNCSADGGQQDYVLEINRTAGKVGAFWGDVVLLVSNQSLVINQWYYVGFVRSGSTSNWNLNIYINGTSDSTSTTSVNTDATNAGTAIGRAGDYPGQYFSGRISNVQIYNRALSATEVLQNFNATKGRFGL